MIGLPVQGGRGRVIAWLIGASLAGHKASQAADRRLIGRADDELKRRFVAVLLQLALASVTPPPP